MALDAMANNYIGNTNRLTHITGPTPSTNFTEDIDGQLANNYTYDAIRNLKTDAAEVNTNIDWNVYGKILSINKAGGTITYTYDATGNRVSKTVGTKTTVYVRDATGNKMALYETINASIPTQTEIHQYGNSRLRIQTPHNEPTPTSIVAAGFGTSMFKVANLPRRGTDLRHIETAPCLAKAKVSSTIATNCSG